MAKECQFCNIAQGKDEKTTLLYQDEQIIVFKDIKPAAKHHFLVCPRRHFKDAKTLTRINLPLVEDLLRIGKQVLEEQGGDVTKARYGFHWPPFTMITHLHLHVISPESDIGFLARQIFKPNSWWFVTIDWLMDHLKKMPDTGGRVVTTPEASAE